MAKRRLWDFYPTPDWAMEALLEESRFRLPIGSSVTILEPCSGDHALTKVLRKHRPESMIYTNDLDTAKPAEFHFDVAQPESWVKLPIVDWVVTNPPFDLAMKILKNALLHAKLGVAFLLRLSFLEPVAERAEFLHLQPPNGLQILPRISFTGDGKTDSVTAAWLVWDKFNKEQWHSVVLPKNESLLEEA